MAVHRVWQSFYPLGADVPQLKPFGYVSAYLAQGRSTAEVMLGDHGLAPLHHLGRERSCHASSQLCNVRQPTNLAPAFPDRLLRLLWRRQDWLSPLNSLGKIDGLIGCWPLPCNMALLILTRDWSCLFICSITRAARVHNVQ